MGEKEGKTRPDAPSPATVSIALAYANLSATFSGANATPVLRFSRFFFFLPLADKEESGDEEEGDNGNVIFQTANTCFRAPQMHHCFFMSSVIKN